MGEDCFVFLKNLPTSVRALTTENSDGTYTIFINSRLSYEQQCNEYKHEIGHIGNYDFEKDCNVSELEFDAHRRNK